MRLLFALAVALVAAGCTGSATTTEDSTKLEVELPKVEVNETPDLDPRTDDDVDVKTPTSG